MENASATPKPFVWKVTVEPKVASDGTVASKCSGGGNQCNSGGGGSGKSGGGGKSRQ